MDFDLHSNFKIKNNFTSDLVRYGGGGRRHIGRESLMIKLYVKRPEILEKR